MPQIWRIMAILIPLLIVIGVYLVRPSTLTSLTGDNVDILLTSTGCSTEHFVLPAQRTPRISLLNRADQAMVFSLPKMAIAKTIASGERIDLDLPPYIMGQFDFFCLTDSVHTSIGGMPDNTGLVCGLEPVALRPHALTSGIFEIEPHNRLKDLLESHPPSP